MMNEQRRMDVITNNLANATTVGYKKEGATSQSFDEVMGIKAKDATNGYRDSRIGNMSLGVKIGETYRDFDQGSFRNTDATFDLAISGDGFFTVSFTNKAGEESTLYTRDGSFTMTKDGYLVTKDGDFVLGQGGPVVMPTDAEIKIDELGNIYADGEYVDQLQMTDFEDYNYLEQYGENLFRAVDGAKTKDASGSINQGYLEMSNVQVVEEMVEMITTQRAYEAAQKFETTMDSVMEKTVTLGQIK
jgi:flagellar basal-body rod protein FlgG